MENDDPTDDLAREAAAAQLQALRTDRAALAERVVQPWWYDVCLGLLLFGFLASYAFDSLWVTLPALVVFGAGLSALVHAYRRLTGVWVQPDRRAWTIWLPLVLLVLVPALVLAEGFDQHWAMVVAGAVLGVAIALLSRWWTRRWVAELRSTP